MRKFWTSVHGLRGFAALLVVIHHIPQYIRAHGTPSFPQFEIGAFGVDIFFAISGFVMYGATNSLAINPLNFIRDRAIRILPLYWITTIVLGATLLLAPKLFPTYSTSVQTILQSVAFIPVYGDRGYIRPLLAMGWTLHYEVFFYVMTAIFLFKISNIKNNRALLASTTIGLGSGIIWLAGIDTRFSFTQILAPISIEFLFGAMIGSLAANTNFLQTPIRRRCLIATPLLILSVYLLHISKPENTDVSLHRLLFWGVPGASILISSLLFEELFEKFSRRSSLIHLIGNASYAIYLTHGISFSISNKITNIANINNPIAISFVLFLGAMSIGILTHIHIEKSLQRWISCIFKKSR